VNKNLFFMSQVCLLPLSTWYETGCPNFHVLIAVGREKGKVGSREGSKNPRRDQPKSARNK
jgi:hypothetical protein